MCGIVAYFGGAGNNLTRVLTGMSAIIYRAPDSTGVAMFGDDNQPVRTRKAVGSVERLIEELLENGAYQNHENRLLSVWSEGSNREKMVELQRRLIAFEGLPFDYFEKVIVSKAPYPSYDELVDLKADRSCRLNPGQPGRPNFDVSFFIRSRKDLINFVRRLIKEYDLSPVVIREIIRQPLKKKIAQKKAEGLINVETADILNTFDKVFEKMLSALMMIGPAKGGGSRVVSGNPAALKSLWRCLPETAIEIPSDYDRDGVCCLFRLLDAALLAAIPARPDLIESLEKILETSWPHLERPKPVDWRRLYGAEKGVNIYGRAAAAALMSLQRDDFLTELPGELSRNYIMKEASIVPGQSDPVSLRYFTQPLIAHGRWALQSAVTVKNSHPFLDEKRFRSVVINGQFDGKTEDSIRKFLAKVAKFSFRSENSAEYLPLLWGYYFGQLIQAQRRYRGVLTQVENNLQVHGIGSSVIDYSVHRTISGKTPVELDEAAFIEAADQISKNGGQVAACGISILSPRRLYVAVRNRPVYVVRRLENDDFMVVSDINAALGLFPRQLIYEKRKELENLEVTHNKKVAGLKEKNAGVEDSKALKKVFEKEKAEILKAFSVEVHVLEGEEIFARIEPLIVEGSIRRSVTITDFKGQRLPDLEPFATVLNPVQVKKDLDRSFYETHLAEIPQRLLTILGNYAPEEDRIADLGIRKSLLRRRFGSDFSGLKRIILAGTGSAFHMCEIGKGFIHTIMPQMDVLAVRPADIENPESLFAPEKDLVILLSWSSTTADMVLLAKKLLSLKVIMTCITEKTFADMALIVAKSGGVMPAFSGEEVTVSGIKSTICMLFCLKLFCLWLTSHTGREKEALSYLERMHRVPYVLANLLEDETVRKFSKRLARENAPCKANIVVSALFSNGAGKEIALKLEENSWSGVGRALDYREVMEKGLPSDLARVLVVVDATCAPRLDEALEVMELFYRKKVNFTAVGLERRQEERIRQLSRDRCIFLHGLKNNALQPLVALVFYYQLAFYYGQSHGIGLGVAPRNLAKSITVGRSLFTEKESPAKELLKIKIMNERSKAALKQSLPVKHSNIWQKEALTNRSRQYYEEMHKLAARISSNDLPGMICQALDENTNCLAHYLFDVDSDIDEIVFAPMDRASQAAVKSAARIWSRFLDYPVRIILPESPLDAFSNNILLFTVASSPAGQQRLPKRPAAASIPVFRLEPGTGFCYRKQASNNGGKFLLKNGFEHARGDYLYAAINLIFINAWHAASPEKADMVSEHFRRSAETVLDVLANPDFKAAVSTSMAVNKKYETMFYIGPPTGVGLAWSDKFDRAGAMLCEPHPFGESAHGPLVTVDSRVDAKFVTLESRNEMLAKFGPEKIVLWEKSYLADRTIDEFIEAPPLEPFSVEKAPFFADGTWYLPELQRNYNTLNDNLIVMDATWDRYLDKAIDEISTFGSRHPRMILMTQQTFLTGKAKEALYRFPVSSTIVLPETPAGPVPEMHLPFVLNIIGEELAACFDRRRTEGKKEKI